MDRVMDILSLLAAPVGFLIGIAILAFLELLGAGFWVSAGVLTVVAVLFILKNYVASRTSFVRLFLPKIEREMHDRMERREFQIERYAFPLGLIVAFIATQFWPVQSVFEVVFFWI